MGEWFGEERGEKSRVVSDLEEEQECYEEDEYGDEETEEEKEDALIHEEATNVEQQALFHLPGIQNCGRLLAIAEGTLAEFLGKATGIAVDLVQMIVMKPGPDSIGIIAVPATVMGLQHEHAASWASIPRRLHQKDLSTMFLEVSLADLQGDKDHAFRKIRLRAEDVQGKNVLTNFGV